MGQALVALTRPDCCAACAKYVFNSELKTPIKRNRNGDSAGVLGAARLWDN